MWREILIFRAFKALDYEKHSQFFTVTVIFKGKA